MLILACLLLTGCMTGGGTDDPDTKWVSLSDAPALPEVPENQWKRCSDAQSIRRFQGKNR